MHPIDDVIKKYGIETWIQIVLICLAIVCYGVAIFNLPFADYDEATYAKVIVHTMQSGDLSNFTRDGANWFEKPPLYLWLAMGSVKLFGEHEFAFRIPSVLASLICLWLVYAIVRELTGSPLTAASAFLILLFTPPFFVFAREARLDSGVIMAILAVVFFWIRGWRDDKWLFWIFPAIAVGFLFKSVIVLLIAPILLVYCVFNWRWSWLSSRYFWWGLPLSLLILLPWHLAETLRFGSIFWNEYMLRQVFQRGVSTITGTNNYYDYVRILWLYYTPWLWVAGGILLTLPCLGLLKKYRSRIEWLHVLPPLASALFIFLLFTAAQTHLSTYIMPVFPFLAMFMALAIYYFSSLLKGGSYVVLAVVAPLVIFGGLQSFAALDELVTPFHYEERDIGIALKQHRSKPTLFTKSAPAYSLDWPQHESINYYGNTQLQFLDPRVVGGREVEAPFYLVTTTLVEPFLYAGVGLPRPGYESLKVLYQGDFLVLMYSDRNIRMPVFIQQ